jgi:hypothetical protein
MIIPIFLMFLFQHLPIRSLGEFQKVDAAAIRAISAPQGRTEELQQQLLYERFQKLLDALESFANAHNKGRGAVWRREAEEIRKAYREFERSLFPEQSRNFGQSEKFGHQRSALTDDRLYLTATPTGECRRHRM